MNCNDCGAAKDATNRIHKDKLIHERSKLLIVCMSVLLGVAMICGTVLGCYTIREQQNTIIEQQYALNMQYASLMEYIAGAEITESVAESGDGGTAVAGQGNTVVGGDMNG